MKPKQETVPISFRVPVTRLETLKRIARARAVELDTDVQLADLVREALEKAFPTESEHA